LRLAQRKNTFGGEIIMKKEVNTLSNRAILVLWAAGLAIASLPIYGNSHLAPSADLNAADPLLSLCLIGSGVASLSWIFAKRRGDIISAFINLLGGIGLAFVIGGAALCFDSRKWVGVSVFAGCACLKLFGTFFFWTITDPSPEGKSLEEQYRGRIVS
jgi:hypothetical protein